MYATMAIMRTTPMITGSNKRIFDVRDLVLEKQSLTEKSQSNGKVNQKENTAPDN